MNEKYKSISHNQASEETYANKDTSEKMPPDDHLTRKISSVIKINGNLLTENNLNSSNAAKIASPMERKNKDTEIDRIREHRDECITPRLAMKVISYFANDNRSFR